MYNNDDMAPLIEDYFKSGAAREDMEAMTMAKKRAQQEQITLRDGTVLCKASVSWRHTNHDGTIEYGYIHTLQGVIEVQQTGEHTWIERVVEEDEEWSDQDSRFITPAIDLDTHTEQVLDASYGPTVPVVVPTGDPHCEQCHGAGCAQCSDTLYYQEQDFMEQYRRDLAYDRSGAVSPYGEQS